MEDGKERGESAAAGSPHEEEGAWVLVAFSTALDLTPGVGTAKGIVQFVLGRDFITGEEVDRGWELVGLIPLAKVFKGVAKLAKVVKQEKVVEKVALKQKKVLMDLLKSIKPPPNASKEVLRAFYKKIQALTLRLEETAGKVPLTKTVVSKAERAALTRAYRKQMEDTIKKTYGHNPVFAEKLLQRLKTMDVDHILDLCLGGENSFKNLQLLNASINRSFGSQMQHALKKPEVQKAIREYGLEAKKLEELLAQKVTDTYQDAVVQYAVLSELRSICGLLPSSSELAEEQALLGGCKNEVDRTGEALESSILNLAPEPTLLAQTLSTMLQPWQLNPEFFGSFDQVQNFQDWDQVVLKAIEKGTIDSSQQKALKELGNIAVCLHNNTLPYSEGVDELFQSLDAPSREAVAQFFPITYFTPSTSTSIETPLEWDTTQYLY